MKRTNQDRLLKEIFAIEEPSNFRETSLERGLAVIRRKRQMHRLTSFGIFAAVLILIIWQIGSRHQSSSSLNQVGMVASPAPIFPKVPNAEIKVISDEELLALFPDRPVALIGKRGHQRLVFLDEFPSQSGAKL